MSFEDGRKPPVIISVVLQIEDYYKPSLPGIFCWRWSKIKLYILFEFKRLKFKITSQLQWGEQLLIFASLLLISSTF